MENAFKKKKHRSLYVVHPKPTPSIQSSVQSIPSSSTMPQLSPRTSQRKKHVTVTWFKSPHETEVDVQNNPSNMDEKHQTFRFIWKTKKKPGPWLNHHYSNPGPTPQKMGLLRPGQVKLHLHTVGSSTGRGEDLIFPRTSLSSLGLRENI